MKQAMHIGIDVRLWDETGVGRYIRNLIINLQEIDKKNFYTLFILPKDKKDITSVLSHPNWHIVETPIRWHTWKEQFLFTKLLALASLDLMHFPYFSVPVFYKKPFVVTMHDLIPYHYPTGKASTLPAPFYWLKFSAYRYIVRHAVGYAMKIITPSQATKSELMKIFPVSAEKIVVIHEGYDNEIHAKSKKSPLPDPYFLYVGNAYPHKNLERLIRAFRDFKKKTNNRVKLVLVGKEDYFYKRLKSFVQSTGITAEVIFASHLPDDELARYYDYSLALVAPSVMEGFGLPVLEALTRGVLVIASHIPAFVELCKDSALYFDPKSDVDLASILRKVAFGEIKNAAILKKKGKILAKKFSWKSMSRETQSIYESCVSL